MKLSLIVSYNEYVDNIPYVDNVKDMRNVLSCEEARMHYTIDNTFKNCITWQK